MDLSWHSFGVAIVVLAAATTTPLAAQQVARARVGIEAPQARADMPQLQRVISRPSSGTYWKEGALILGIPAAIGMYLFSSADDGDAPGGTPVRDGLVAGLIGGALGGLIGFFIPKR